MGLERETSHSSTGQIEMDVKPCKVLSSTILIQFILVFLETFESNLNFKNITEVLEGIVIIQVNHITESFQKDKLVKLLRNIKPLPVYPDGLFTIDLRDYFRGKNIKQIMITLNTRRLNSSTLLIGKISVNIIYLSDINYKGFIISRLSFSPFSKLK